ncbi:MAG: hypothetical protein ACR2JC_06440 [Chloroflexota bacterium]
MPLNPAKAKHITAKLNALFLQRAQPVTLTLLAPGGATSTLTINAIFRLEQDADPTLGKEIVDAIMLCRTADVTLAQLRSCIYVQPAANSAAALLASKYLITSILPKGILPGGDRYIVSLDRQR